MTTVHSGTQSLCGRVWDLQPAGWLRAILALFTETGLGSSLQRFVPEYHRTKQYSRLFKTFFFSQAYRAVSGLVVCAVMIACFPLYASWLKLDGHFRGARPLLLRLSRVVPTRVLQVTFNGMLKQVMASLTDVLCTGLEAAGRPSLLAARRSAGQRVSGRAFARRFLCASPCGPCS